MSLFNTAVPEEINDILSILMSADAVSCTVDDYEPIFYKDNALYKIPSGHVVTVDYNKMAEALYNAGYRKEEKDAGSL